MFDRALQSYFLHKGKNKMKMMCRTHSGILFDLADPKAVDVDITDVAHQLSMQVRFNGACSRFYSNAEHSINCAKVAQRFPDLNVHPLFALFHDAAEAYVGDMISPLKKNDGFFKDVEEKILVQVFKKVAPDLDFFDQYDKHKVIDHTVTMIEGNALVSKWEGYETDFVKYFGKVVRIESLNPNQGFEAFLDMYLQLKDKENAKG